jgi:hypothetical protein
VPSKLDSTQQNYSGELQPLGFQIRNPQLSPLRHRLPGKPVIAIDNSPFPLSGLRFPVSKRNAPGAITPNALWSAERQLRFGKHGGKTLRRDRDPSASKKSAAAAAHSKKDAPGVVDAGRVDL